MSWWDELRSYVHVSAIIARLLVFILFTQLSNQPPCDEYLREIDFSSTNIMNFRKKIQKFSYGLVWELFEAMCIWWGVLCIIKLSFLLFLRLIIFNSLLCCHAIMERNGQREWMKKLKEEETNMNNETSTKISKLLIFNNVSTQCLCLWLWLSFHDTLILV